MAFDAAIASEIWSAKYRFAPPQGAPESDVAATWARVASALAGTIGCAHALEIDMASTNRSVNVRKIGLWRPTVRVIIKTPLTTNSERTLDAPNSFSFTDGVRDGGADDAQGQITCLPGGWPVHIKLIECGGIIYIFVQHADL